MSDLRKDWEDGKKHVVSRIGATISVLATGSGALCMASDQKAVEAIARNVIDERGAALIAFGLKTLSTIPESIINTLGSVALGDKNFDVITNSSPDAFQVGLGMLAIGLALGAVSAVQFNAEKRASSTKK